MTTARPVRPRLAGAHAAGHLAEIAARRCAAAAGQLARDLIAGLLPQRCAACGGDCGDDPALCARCRGAIPRVGYGVCCRCLARGRDGAGCTAHPEFVVWPAWVYDERARAVVHALKYEGLVAAAAPLGPELARAIAHGRGADAVVEVPLHPARLRERGYNQAALLARALATALEAPWRSGALVRVRPTRAQARLDPAGRRANVRDAFRVADGACVRGRTVIVVDDVMTTGATLEACLERLRAEGASPVGVVLAWAQ